MDNHTIYQNSRNYGVTISRAQNAIDNYKSKIGGTRNWFQKVLDILKIGKYVRIKLYTKNQFTYDEYDKRNEFADFVDIEAITDTGNYASFFDIFNHEYMINFDFEPVPIDKLEYSLRKFYHKYYKIN